VLCALAVAALLGVAAAGSAQAKLPQGAAPKSALVLAERVLQHAPAWRPTTIYCLRPRHSAYRSKSVPHGTQTTFRCQWVKQNNPTPWEIDTIQVVDSSSRAYLFTLVSRPFGRGTAVCSLEPGAHGTRTTCRMG
jgi:hypothetical protein